VAEYHDHIEETTIKLERYKVSYAPYIYSRTMDSHITSASVQKGRGDKTQGQGKTEVSRTNQQSLAQGQGGMASGVKDIVRC
jgi:hypothetical protein